MSVVQSPAPMRPCPKCGAEPGEFCRSLAVNQATPPGTPLKGNRSHAERYPSRAVSPVAQPELPKGRVLHDPLSVECPVCKAQPDAPCRRTLLTAGTIGEGGTIDGEFHDEGTGPPMSKPHLGRRLVAHG